MKNQNNKKKWKNLFTSKRAQAAIATAIKVVTSLVLGGSILVGTYGVVNSVVVPATQAKLSSIAEYSGSNTGEFVFPADSQDIGVSGTLPGQMGAVPEVFLSSENSQYSFSAAQLILSSGIGISFYVRDVDMPSVSSSYAKIMFDTNRDGSKEENIVNAKDAIFGGVPCQKYYFGGLAPDNMGEQIVATLYYTDESGEHEGGSITYSVVNYIENMAGVVDDDYDVVLSNLLAYGISAEAYTGNSSVVLTESLQSLLDKASTNLVANTAASNKKALYYSPGVSSSTASVVWKSVGLNFRDAAALMYVFRPATGADISDYSMKITFDGNTYTYPMSESYYESAYGAYVLRFRELGPADTKKTVLAYFVDKDNKRVSGNLQYSIESYAYSAYQKRNEKPELFNLTQSYIRYCDSITNYFQIN